MDSAVRIPLKPINLEAVTLWPPTIRCQQEVSKLARKPEAVLGLEQLNLFLSQRRSALGCLHQMTHYWPPENPPVWPVRA